MKTKICSKCKLEKSIEEFRKTNSSIGNCCWCKICEKQYKKKYYQKNKEKIDSQNKKYKEIHEDEIKIFQQQYWQNNKEKLSEKQKEYNKNHKEEIREQKKVYDVQKRKNDPIHKMKQNIRSSIRMSLKKTGFSKSSHTFEILGCSYDDICKYLFENAKIRYPNFQINDFLESNKYHIDHIIPLATANSQEDIIRLCHYTNLQLLTKEDNLIKLDSLEWR